MAQRSYLEILRPLWDKKMNKPTRYVRYTESVDLSGKMISEEELGQIVTQLEEDTTTRPGYTSVYSFGEDVVEYFNTHQTVKGNKGSLSGYDGEALTNSLLFDLDSEDLSKSYQDAQNLVNRLTNQFKFNLDSISVFFSGGKGFHVKVRISQELTADQLKTICSHIAHGKEVNGEFPEKIGTFDPKIYNKTRLIRIVNTKHEKTGLYKVELPMADFLSGDAEDIDFIKSYAKEPNFTFQHSPSFLPQELLDLAPKNATIIKSVQEAALTQDIRELNFGKKPAEMPYCKFAILNGFFQQGNRNDCLLAMAAYYKSQGYPVEITNPIIESIVEIQESRYKSTDKFTRQQIWETITSYVYGPNYKGGVPNCRTSETLKQICQSTGMHDHCSGEERDNLGIQSILQLDDSYVKYINTLDTNLIITGIEFLDKNTKLIKGTSNYVAGRSGAGKTTLILGTLRNTNKSGINSIFFSADTSAIIVYQRMVASVTGLPQEEIEEIYKQRDKKRIQEFREKVQEVYGRTTFNVKSSITLDIIRDSIDEVQNRIGAGIDFVVVDYNERVMNQFSDPLNSVRHTALNLVDISRDMDKCFLTVAQVSRTKGSERTPLTSKNAAKESGAVEESANMLATIWRPLYGTNDDRFMGICIPKNRMGREGIKSLLYFDGAKSIVRDANDSEKYECEHLMEQLAAEEAEKGNGDRY
jgi:KaiC/GvpD/RAD55 family RecA-like ATPase